VQHRDRHVRAVVAEDPRHAQLLGNQPGSHDPTLKS
jgi:hypothetical protein